MQSTYFLTRFKNNLLKKAIEKKIKENKHILDNLEVPDYSENVVEDIINTGQVEALLDQEQKLLEEEGGKHEIEMASSGFVAKLLDMFMAITSLYAAYLITHVFMASESFFSKIGVVNLLLFPVLLIWRSIFKYSSVYKPKRVLKLRYQLFAAAEAVLVSLACLWSIIKLFGLAVPNKDFLLVFGLLCVGSVVMTKIMITVVVSLMKRYKINTKQAIIVGNPDDVKKVLAKVINSKSWNVDVLGVVTNKEHNSGIKSKYKVLGKVKDLKKIINKNFIDVLFLAIEPDELKAIEPYINVCIQRGITIKICMNYFNNPALKFELDSRRNISYLTCNLASHSVMGVLMKEVFDRVSSLIGIVVVSPILLLAALAIKINSAGPILFKQKRVGKNGRLFNIYKFRSMYIDAEERKKDLLEHNEMSGPVFKIKKDPRITWVGKILRKTSIDELPQLLNVILGDMSLVGPRPPLPDEVEKYSNWQRRRLSVKPGITCTWQISGRNNISFDQWMQMDIKYIDQWSILKDFAILFLTIFTVLSMRGAS